MGRASAGDRVAGNWPGQAERFPRLTLQPFQVEKVEFRILIENRVISAVITGVCVLLPCTGTIDGLYFM